MNEPRPPAPVLDPPAPGAEEDPGTGHRVPRRFWSARRVPAGLAALLLAAGAGLLLYDVVAVRAGHPAMDWRRRLADGLATRPLDDPAVLVGAGVAAALGLLLLVLALTPGRRGLLPMRTPDPDLRVALDRKAAAMTLRDRAVEVSGVQSVRVRVRRRRVDARAVSHFRDLDEVRGDLDSVLTEGIDHLGLARPPSLGLRVRRPGRKG
ncbi:DUF6286 domain-containing protein [Streptomyces sp. LE64]|uniref:DUF6286 domain-containing protein n=1 Tax=Streptomyces sp. LE64 TaxID=3448653 RepID=UPI004042F0B6